MAENKQYSNDDYGLVWITFDPHQAEIICSALQTQLISCVVRTASLCEQSVYRIFVEQIADAPAAQDFIWRDASGMQLKPDWQYPLNTRNNSFAKWIR